MDSYKQSLNSQATAIKIIAVISVILLIVAGGFGISEYQTVKNSEPVTGYITGFIDDYGNYSQYTGEDYKIVVTYTVNGVEYEGVYSVSSSDYKIGKSIKLYYIPGSEADACPLILIILPSVILGSIGAVMLIIVLISALFISGVKRRRDRIRRTWVRTTVSFDRVQVIPGVHVNNRPVYRVFAKYKQGYSDSDRQYQSEMLTFDPSEFFMEDSYIPLYYYPKEERLYYLDVMSIINPDED